MESNFFENVRTLRKQRGMTQEQLAEAMGVTVGAVYKWEQDLSTPDIRIIMEMASFFGVSVDAMVGYEIPASDKERILKELKRIKQEKDYKDCWTKVDGWIRRYPNDFDIVYNSGVLYNLVGIETGNKSYLSRSIELMTHSCALIDQNRDPEISETYIYRDIAIAYIVMEKSQEGIQKLKEHNPCGVNDDLIGQELATKPEHREEALPYLSTALLHVTASLLRLVIGFMNIFFDRKDYASAIQMLQWLIAYMNGLRAENKPSYLDKDTAFLLALCGAVYCTAGQPKEAKDCLRRARQIALEFDAAPNYTSQNIRYCEKVESHVAYDNIGHTAMDTIEQVLQEGVETDDEPVMRLWEEVCNET